MGVYERERVGDVRGIVELLRESDNERVRARAADALGSVSDSDDRDEVVGALVEAASSDDERVAAIAVDSLEELGGDALERLVLELGGRDGETGGDDAETAAAFVGALDAQVPEIRMAAANGLGRLERVDAVDALTDTVDDPDPRVRERAARACGFVGDPRAVGSLADLVTDPVAAVRREAADALGRIGDRRALETLLSLYADEDERVRRIAVGAFGTFGDDRPVEHLVDALTDPSSTVRRTAAYSLVDLLSNAPADGSHALRESVADALSTTDDPGVVEPLAELLEMSTQPPQRRNAAWLLGRVVEDDRRARAIDALVAALGEDDQLLGQFAATGLIELGGDDVAARLRDVVTDEERDASERARATFALGEVGDEMALATVESVRDATESEALRTRAALAASKLRART